jgi:DNA-binding transcriptional LysR family regulator
MRLIVIGDIRRIDLNLLVTLHVLLEERSVSRAANRLALTQPTVSGMLARLRDVFGEPLFVRAQHGMVPTPRAAALAPALEQLLKDAAALVADEQFEPRTVEMDLRLTANDYMQCTVVVPFVEGLRRKAPRVRVAVSNLEITNLNARLARGELDLAITTPRFVQSELESLLLYREEYVCIVREQHPIRSSTVSMRRFLDHDHILVSPSGGAFSGPVDEALAATGVRRRVALSVPSFLVLLEMLCADDLIATVPKRLLVNRARGVRRVRPPVEVEGFDVVAVWHRRLNDDPAHQWLRSELASVARRLA